VSLTTNDVITRASVILLDTSNVRWSVSELLAWVNDGRRDMATLRPDLYAVRTSLSLVPGARQSLPSDGIRLVDITHNTSGPAVTVTQKESLDLFQSNWQSGTQSGTITHFMTDERYPTDFWVYPPASNTASLEIIYYGKPADYNSGDALSTQEGMYLSALVDYVCYRGFAKDTEYAGSADRAVMHYNNFKGALQAGGQISLLTSPNSANIGGTPSRIMGTA